MTESLRKTRKDGVAYARPPEIEEALAAILALPRAEIVERLRVADRRDPRFIPSECLVYLVRRTYLDNDACFAEQLFKALLRRAERSLPVPERALPGGGRGISASALDVRAEVVGRLEELLCSDRNEYDTRLDMFEIRFDFALAKLRSTARRGVERRDRGHEPLSHNDETGEPSREVEEAIGRYRPSLLEKLQEEDYRERVMAAIDTLSEKERNVMELLMKGVAIDSTDPSKPTIVKLLGCVERTARNRRDAAMEKIAKLLDPSPVS